LPTPAPIPDLPGSLHELTVEVDDHRVHAWLCLPHGATAADPAPVMQWIHGGPFMSYNAWSWRWSPWVAVARGWAVVLPDPALSTGYGTEAIARAWPHRAGAVWRDIEGVLDHVLQRDDVDGGRTVCLGGSFGGYMTNWIAGHTDRFRAIVTHAGLWALDQQHTTTDAAHWKSSLFGTPAEHPDWYAENSPNRFVDRIVTPMLVVHGNRDYRVPVSEALRLWWDLVSQWRGAPEQLPHRFLQFTSENHWVLTPGNAQVWYETVLAFCAQHAGVGT
jgi:dipeptidyl aminopeptidase/acylaminoacyl peptidase